MKAVVTHWPSLFETAGSIVETTWSALFDRFSRIVPFRGDESHPGWSAAVFDPPNRGLDNVRAVTAMVLDYDGTEPIEGAQALWGRFYGLIHTTRKHTEDAHRFRVILPLTRPVSPFEYAGLWRRVNALAADKLDPSPKDPSRFWFVPGVKDGAAFRVVRLTGAPMDPDELLSQPEPTEPAAANVARTETTDERERRAIAYIDRMPAAIAGQQGHAAAWAVARKLAQDFGFDESTTFRILWSEYNPRCHPPWTEKELRHKARDAADKAKVSNPVQERHWDVPRTHYAAPRSAPVDADGQVIDGDYIPPDPQAQDEARQREPAAKRWGARTMAELLESVIVRAETQRPERGVTTGNFELDEAIGGYRRQRVTILGAETSFGKSSIAVMAADEGQETGVLLITGEDGPDTYGQRIMARRAQVNALRIRDNILMPDDLAKMKLEAGKGERVPFFLDGIGKPAEELARAVREICAEASIALVIVDYVQAFTCSKRCQDRRAEVTHIARCFVDAIKASNAAGLVLSQLKRPENSNRPPSMHDLKESGDLENMAEHVLLGELVVEGDGDQRKETRWIHIGKNKDGGRNVERVSMPFDMKTASFRTVRGQAFQNRYEDSVYDQFDRFADN